MISNPALPRIAPFGVFIAFIVAQSFLGDAPWLVVARGIAVALVLAFFWRRYIELADRPRARDAALAVAVGLAVFAIWITFDQGWATLGKPGRGFVPVEPDGRIDWALAALRFLALALVVPLAEELFWRSFLLRWIDSRDFLARDPGRASFMAIAVTSALFASEHSLWFAGFIAGAAYSWVYIRTRNLWIPIIAHSTTNGTLGIWILATGSWHHW